MYILKFFIFFLLSMPCFGLTSHELTLEEKVGQILMVHFNGEEANEDARILIQECQVGGFIYYNWANGLNSPSQVRCLSKSLQALAKIPLLIAADQEGGRVARLRNGFTQVAGNGALGKTGTLQQAEEEAFTMGTELKAVGVNLNLAPVVDINSNPKNPVIGNRSFGDTAEIVIPYARAALCGYHRAGIMTTLKHFPGHGDVETDSHEDLPFINKSREQLEKLELLPFIALAQNTECIMTAHIVIPSIDPVNAATLSPEILGLLRKIGFKGVIIADSLVMEGVLKNANQSVEEAAIKALNAGCDILMLGGKQLNGMHKDLELTARDVKCIHKALIKAVHEGRITQERLDDAVNHILELKSSI